MSDEAVLAAMVRDIVESHNDRSQALHEVYQRLDNAGVVPKRTVHRYVCTQGCGVRATIIKAGPLTLVRTRDYKLSPGKNAADSVEAARRKRTLDGDRHWPGHTLDLQELASADGAWLLSVECHHKQLDLNPVDVLKMVRSIPPGHPGKPTLL